MRRLLVFGNSFARRLASSAAKPQSPLASLRKRTGFSISKCKEALEKHENDLPAAEKWLHEVARKEGWARAEQLSGRTTRQGLIGALVRGNRAAMVEVNCETDFVARNSGFQQLVSNVVHSSLDSIAGIPPAPESSFVQFKSTAELLSVVPTNGQHENVNELLVDGIREFGENIVIARGCLMSANEGTIFSYVYNNNSASSADGNAVGSYAALLHLLPNSDRSIDPEVFASVGHKLSQHIVGMSPQVVRPGNEAEGEPEKSALVTQPLLSDSSIKVGPWLESHGVQVTNFVRFALGETQTD